VSSIEQTSAVEVRRAPSEEFGLRSTRVLRYYPSRAVNRSPLGQICPFVRFTPRKSCDECAQEKCAKTLRLTTDRNACWELMIPLGHGLRKRDESRRGERNSKIRLRRSMRRSDAQRRAGAGRINTSPRCCDELENPHAFLPFATALYKPNAVHSEKLSNRLRLSRVLLPMSHRKGTI